MAELKGITSILKATVLSTKSSVTIEQCNRDYRELQGEWIPFKKFGYKSLEAFFDSLPDFRVVRLPNGSCVVEAKKTNEIKHITDMVSRQKTTKTRYPKQHLQRPMRNIRSGTSWNPGYPVKYNKSSWNAPQEYKKPKVPVKQVIQPQQPIIVKKEKPIENSTRIPPVTSVVQVPKANPVVTVFPATEKKTLPLQNNSNNVPTSKLSGVKPGDILSGKHKNSAVHKENKDASSATNSSKTSAANRLTNLQKNFKNLEPVQVTHVPKVNNDVTELPAPDKSKSLMRQESLDIILAKLPDNKTRLEKCCEFMGLPKPVFKTVPIKNGKLNVFDCTVKIGTEYTFSSYPDSQRTESLAIEKACSAGLDKLKKVFPEESHPVSNATVAVSRLILIALDHPCGVWANTLPGIYKDQYKEHLPNNWLELLDNCPNITKEYGMNDMVMILPASESPISTPQSDTNDTPRNVGLPVLQFPDNSLWNVYVMSASSTVEIWLRIIGEEYSDAFETLLTDMEMYYMDNNEPADVVEGGWYSLFSGDSWLRVRVLEIYSETNSALCFLVDSGDEETFSFDSFRDLPPQFLSLPPQAILCRLAGLEEYALVGEVDNNKSYLSEELSGRTLVAEVLETPDEKQDDPSITVVLFDTSTDEDININKELLRKLSERATAPHLPPGVSEVYVMDVTTSGKVCAQIHNDSWKLLQNMLHQISNGPIQLETLQGSFGEIVPSPSINYLIKSGCGEWRRGILRSGVTEDPSGSKYVSVRYIDCGRTENVPVKNLIMLDRISDALNKFPTQVLYLTLHNVGNLNSDQMEKINKLVPRNCPVLCKQISGNTVVELFVRTQPHNVLCSVNNALILERELSEKLKLEDPSLDPLLALNKKKERLFFNKNSLQTIPVNQNSNKKDKLLNILPQKGTYFDVHVCMASNPRNFVVQPLQYLQELFDLMKAMQTTCEKLPKPINNLSKNKIYGVYHENTKQWYRASFLGMPSKDNSSMYFIDYGDYYTTTIDALRELPQEFTNLPPLAIKAKLHGVKPKDQDWSVEDCVRFIELVNEQSFASLVHDIEKDPMNEGDIVLVLDLIDTSTPEDLYVNTLLIKENRAVAVK